MDGFNIIHKTDDKIIATGDVKYYETKTSTSCDKTIDPDCNFQVYGKCFEDYDAIITYKIEMVFKN